MTPLLRVALCCAGLLSSSTAFAATDPTMAPEERAIRTAYAKVIFAVQLQTVEQAAHQKHRKLDTPALNNALEKNDLHITLSGFTIGDVSEIAQHNIQDLVSLPHGEDILVISDAPNSYKEHGRVTEETSVAIPQWQSGSSGGQSTVSYTLAEVLAVNQPTDVFLRYATFNVAVTFQGKARKYRALVLFGKDAKGADKVLVTDTVLGSVPQDMMTQSIYPAILLDTSLGDVPAVMSWFEGQQMPATACTVQSQEVCCDPSSLKCGISTVDLKHSAAYVQASQPSE